MKRSKVAWALAYLFLTNGAFADTYHWTGMDPIDPHDWAFHENWAEGELPSGLADLVFPSSTISYNPQHQSPLYELKAINSMMISSSMEYRIEGLPGNLIPIGGTGTITIDGSGTKKLTLQYMHLSAPTAITSHVSSAASSRQLNYITGDHRLTLSSPNGGSFLLNGNSSFKGGVTVSTGTLFTGVEGIGSGALELGDNALLKPTGSFTLANDLSFVDGCAQIDTHGFDLNLSGTLSGNHFMKLGAGELRLSGVNHYGNTTLFAGTIGIVNSGALGHGAVAMNPQTILKIRNGATPIILTNPFILHGGDIDTNGSALELAGVIEGATLTKLGAGKLTLSAANTYEGGTFLREGVLAVKDSSALGTGALILSEGTLLRPETSFLTLANDLILEGEGIQIDLNGLSHFGLSGAIHGPHAMKKLGEGALILSGAHTFSGGVDLVAGSIELGHPNANLGSGPIALAAGTTLQSSADVMLANRLTLSGQPTIYTSSGKLSLWGDFSGGTGLMKMGPGVLELAANGVATTEMVTVSEGKFAVDGALASDVDIYSGATLSGAGIITGDVVNLGTMAPGSVGTMTIIGDYIQVESATYENEVNLANSDLLKVQGNVTIEQNTLFRLFPNPESDLYVDGTSYAIIDTNGFGDIIGTFTNLTSTAPLISGELSYPASGDQVILTLKVKEITSAAAVGNGSFAATGLNKIGAMAHPGVDGIFRVLSALSEEERALAFEQMHPNLYKGMTLVQENNAVQVRSALSERLQVVLDNKHHYRPTGEVIPCETKGRNTHFWLTAVGDLLHQADTVFLDSPQIGYQGNSGGFVAGIDYHFASYFYAGVIGAYTHSDVKWKYDRGLGDIDSGYAGVYLSAIGQMFYGNFSIVGSFSQFDQQRNIIFPGVHETAKNTHDGKQLITHLDTGINLGVKGFTIRPFDSLDWIVQREDSFTEKGAGENNLAVRSTRANMLRNELGLNFAGCRCFNGVKASFDTKVGWIRELRLSGEGMEWQFANSTAPVIFPTTGYFPNRNLLSVGASVSAIAINDRLTCTLYYNGAFGQKYSDNGMGGQLSIGF